MQDFKDHVQRRPSLKPGKHRFKIKSGKANALQIVPQDVGKQGRYAPTPPASVMPEETGQLSKIFSITAQIVCWTTCSTFLLIVLIALWLSQESFWKPNVQQVYTSSLTMLSPKEVYQISGLSQEESITPMSLRHAFLMLQQHPLIEEVQLRLLYPQQLFVSIHEEQPYAYLRVQDRFYLIDQQQRVLTEVKPPLAFELPVLGGLPRIDGQIGTALSNFSVEQGLELIALLKQHQFKWDVIEEIDITSPFNLKLSIKSPPMLVHLGHHDYLKRIQLFKEAYPQLIRKHPKLQSADLTQDGKVIIHPGRVL